jgi:hypothetical protein
MEAFFAFRALLTTLSLPFASLLRYVAVRMLKVGIIVMHMRLKACFLQVLNIKLGAENQG